MRRVLVLAMLAAMANFARPVGAAVAGDAGDSTLAGNSTVAARDSAGLIPQRDVIDVLNQFLHRPVPAEFRDGLSFGLDWSLLPTFSYNPVYGFALGAMVSGAGRMGPKTARYSQLAIAGNYSTEGQLQVQFRGDVYGGSGNHLLKVDCRYLDTNRSTWGLGPLVPGQQEYPMAFKLVRAHATEFRRIRGPVFLGLGYHLDQYQDIVDELAAAGSATPYADYSGGTPRRTTASGLSLNVLGDTRDNLVNPTSGYYLSWSLRDYLTDLGGDQNWQELWIEMRVYPHVPSSSRNVLAFWLYGWMTFGPGPYLSLPADGWDMYGRGARGYLQGQIRGPDQIYFESEYRFGLTRDGLLGAVVFFNMTTTTAPESGSFARADHAGGAGLRIKFNKNTNTNLAIDRGWGRDGSGGWFLGMSEVF